MINILIDRFKQYPPALQLLMFVLAVVAGILMWHEFVWGTANDWSIKADQYESAISKAVVNERRFSHASLESAVIILGDKQSLGRKEETKAALSNIINKVLSKHKITESEVSEQTAQESTRSRIKSSLSGDKKLGIVATKVIFKAEPAEVYSIIAQLETHKAVETVSNVRIGRLADPRSKSIAVQLTVEAWYYSTGPSTSSRGSS